MNEEKDPQITVDIGLGARASLEARVSTEIPSQSSGRLLDAVTDIIRPFSERRGFKADQIRLQREEVLIKIAQKARRRLEIENRTVNPLPNKFLVPFLEKASLEETDDIFVDRWADLLASSSADPESANPRYVQILSEMRADEAILLREIALNHKNPPLKSCTVMPNLSHRASTNTIPGHLKYSSSYSHIASLAAGSGKLSVIIGGIFVSRVYPNVALWLSSRPLTVHYSPISRRQLWVLVLSERFRRNSDHVII